MKAPGKLFTVNDTQIHVYKIVQTLTQKDTLVFLSGSGTECPTYDFKPLWNLLLGRYNIVVVERPGYGWSGKTNCPRDIDTMLEETREALRQACISAPLIPVPHSLSGLEAIYWAQKYPDEISAIIGLDMAVPPVYDSMELPKFLPVLVPLAHLLRKIVAKSMVKNHPAVKNNLLNEDEKAAMQYIISRQLLSKNMIDEIGYVKVNARKIEQGKCPSVPVLCFLSNDKENLKRIPTWGPVHHNYFLSNDQITFIDLSCGHYVHREEPETIAQAIIQFLG